MALPWHGVQVVLDEHKAMCRATQGQGNTIILCGRAGSGKSSAVEAVVRGVTGVQPERALIVKFHRSTGLPENQKLEQMYTTFGLGKDTTPNAFGEFLVDSVWKKEKATIKAFRSAGNSVAKSIQDRTDGNCCAPKTDEVMDDEIKDDGGGKQIIPIFGLPVAEAVDFGNSKRNVLVLDDLNDPLDAKGPMAQFLLSVAECGRDNGVLSYMITNSQFVAYQIWQLNGGNKFYPLPSTFVQLHPRPSTWKEWAKRDGTLPPALIKRLQTEGPEKVPYFALNVKPFDFDHRAKRELLFN